MNIDDDWVPILVYIVLDDFGEEVSWQIHDITPGLESPGNDAALEGMGIPRIVAEVGEGIYGFHDEVLETVYLEAGHTYRFFIFDGFGDGLGRSYCPFSSYSVILGRNVDSGVRLVNGTGDFGLENFHDFTIPDVSAEPSPAPSQVTPMPTMFPTSFPSATPTVTSSATAFASIHHNRRAHLASPGLTVELLVQALMMGLFCRAWFS